jgi:hypothetical protein
MDDCPRKSRSIKKEYIHSVKPEVINSYMLPHKNNVYIEYLRVRDQPFEISLVKNHQLVAEHLKAHGYILVNPIEKHVTPDCCCKACIQN